MRKPQYSVWRLHLPLGVVLGMFVTVCLFLHVSVAAMFVAIFAPAGFTAALNEHWMGVPFKVAIGQFVLYFTVMVAIPSIIYLTGLMPTIY